MDRDDERKVEPLYDEVRVFVWVVALCLCTAGVVWCWDRLTERSHDAAPQGMTVGGGTLGGGR